MKLFSNHIIKGLLLFFLLGFVQQVRAQFTITESFKGSVGPDIIIGDSAHLTSGAEDPVGAGWLRLTDDKRDQQGYVYINKSFPATLGVLIDFEYTMWRSTSDGNYKGADGLSVFLFNAEYGPEDDGTRFKLGAYGGSLGYANNTLSDPPSEYGLNGGYLGVGLDSYGNFTRKSEGKNGGPGNLSPNSIVMRGPNTGDSSTTTRYLEGVTILDSANGNIVDAMNGDGNASDNVVDYNVLTSTRPTREQFYRRVQIEVNPTSDGKYKITVRWATSFGGSFRHLMTYTTTDIPPAYLKVGFAASTGGGYNNQEIRNILVTTPGNLRIVKKADKDVLRTVDNGNQENQITYTIQVINDTKADLHNIQFEDQLTDAVGNQIADTMFDITNISYSGFLSGTSLPSTSSDNHFTGSLNLEKDSTGIITVTGTLHGVPSGNILNNTAHVIPTDIMDQDLGNNTSKTSTPVISGQSDLVISQEVDNPCLDPVNGNTFTIKVANMGSSDVGYTSSAPVKVTGILHPGATIINNSTSDWSYSISGNTFTFTTTGTGTLNSGSDLPPISYTINSNSAFTDTVSVHCEGEASTNDGPNNHSELSIKTQPDAPTLPPGTTNPIVYYVGENAEPLSAVATNGNTLKWYLNPGGAPSNIPFTPSTATTGTTSYYVSQTNGHCESNLTEIIVNVVEVPTISGTVFNDINGLSDGQIDDGSGVNGLTDLWVVAVDQTSDTVVEATAVSQYDGTYTLGLTASATYNLILIHSATPPVEGAIAPSAGLPVNWANTGENLGAGTGNDGTVDGILEVIFSGSDITNANFGIRFMKPVRTNPQLLNPAREN